MSSVNSDCVTVPVSRWKTWLVAFMAIFLVAGHCYDMATMREHWPFSYYPMYGRLQKHARLDVLGLYGVMAGSDRNHLEQITTGDYVPPLGEVTLRNVFMSSWGRDGTIPGAKRRTTELLRDYLRAYETRRAAGLHNGPPMLEARLCMTTYVLRADGAGQKARSIKPLLGVKANGQVMDYALHPTSAPTETVKESTVHSVKEDDVDDDD